MNIVFCSVPFRPSVGGIETVSELLAEEFQHQGHTVTLVTQTPATGPDAAAFRIVRRPGFFELLQLVRDADVVFHSNISLQMAWPLLLLRRPWVVVHHTWIPRTGLAGRLKRRVLRYASNVSVSRAMANDLPVPSVVVPNPYRAALFRVVEGVSRELDVIFVGRLVSDKGADVLVAALGHLRDRGLRLRTTIVGSGPEEDALRDQVRKLGLAAQVEFTGHRSGEALVQLLNRHRTLVVPSVWEEPFGIVVLEAIACGCLPLVAQSGGLPDAAGAVGRVFAKSNAGALADHLADAHAAIQSAETPRTVALGHLAAHRPDRVAARYLQILSDACLQRARSLAA
jgi:glycosyltransferase involved in cell wall biosynthesis